MNSTEIAWRKFLKTEMADETVPAKDVSLEGKLDTISAQLNRIAVDSERVASTVPDLLGDKGLEETLADEEVPELDDLAEEGGDEAVAGEEVGDAETIGDEDDPEGIFTEDGGSEDDAIVEASESGEDGAVKPQADPVTPAEDGVPAEFTNGEAEGDDESEVKASEEIAESEDGEATEGDDDELIVEEPEEDDELIVEEPESDEEGDDELVVEEPESDEEAEEADVAEGDDESEEADEKAKEIEKFKAEAKKAMKKSAYLRMIAKADKEDIEPVCDEKDVECEKAEGAATAGSAGVANAKFGDIEEETEKIEACAKSLRFFKYGVGPEQTRADGKRGHTGEGQKKPDSQRKRGHYTDRQYAYEAKQKRDKRKKEGAKGNPVTHPATRTKPGLTASGTTRVPKGKTYGKARAGGSKRSEASETISEKGKGHNKYAKSVMASSIPTKHIATMGEVMHRGQRPVAKAIANGDIVRPRLGASSIRKNVQMGYGVDPKDVTAGDWEDYRMEKARRGL